MKKATILIFILFSLAAQSQTDTTKITAKYVYEDVKAGFMKLVNSLEGPAKHTYTVYVRQYYINGWSSILLEGFLLIIVISILITALKRGKWGDDGPENFWAIFQIVFGLLFLVFVGVFASNFAPNIQRISNPEYYAIQDIISTIK